MSDTCKIHYSDGFGRCPFEIKVQNLESQLREANAKAERYKEALEGIERWCISIKKTYQPSIFAKGCITPTGETILAENLENLAKTALEEKGE